MKTNLDRYTWVKTKTNGNAARLIEADKVFDIPSKYKELCPHKYEEVDPHDVLQEIYPETVGKLHDETQDVVFLREQCTQQERRITQLVEELGVMNRKLALLDEQNKQVETPTETVHSLTYTIQALGEVLKTREEEHKELSHQLAVEKARTLFLLERRSGKTNPDVLLTRHCSSLTQ